MKITPVEDKVILKMAKAEEKTESGLFLTGATKDETVIGEVVAVGPGGLVGGVEVNMTVAAGQKVVIDDARAKAIKVGGEKYTVVKMADILAIVE